MHALSSSSLENLLGIVLRTQYFDLYQLSRSVVVDLIIRLLSPAGSGEFAELRMSLKYEAGCWVDGMTEVNTGGFCRLIESVSLASTPVMVSCLRMFRDIGFNAKSIPDTLPSRIMVQALGDLPHSSMELALLTVQVSSQCLLFDSNPKLLASLILAVAHELEKQHFASLVAYARRVVFCDGSEAPSKLFLSTKMLETCFSASSNPFNLFARVSLNKLSSLVPKTKRIRNHDILALMRHLIHFAKLTKQSVSLPARSLLGRMLPAALSVRFQYTRDVAYAFSHAYTLLDFAAGFCSLTVAATAFCSTPWLHSDVFPVSRILFLLCSNIRSFAPSWALTVHHSDFRIDAGYR